MVKVFEAATGLNINCNKSVIFGVNVSSRHTDEVANCLGITTQFLPIGYLGAPLGGKPTSPHFLENINYDGENKKNYAIGNIPIFERVANYSDSVLSH